ncbi:MAG: hypothetical protein ACRC3J_05060 [Culicoidibacterales bacterium]
MKKAGKLGLTVEARFIKANNWTVSSKEDNIHNDIDAWDGDVSVSIKFQPACLRTGNIALETELIDPKTSEEVDSWFTRGKANRYVFIIGDNSYHADAQQLKAFIKQRDGIKKFRTTQLTARDVIQSNVGRKYCQSRCKLVPLKMLVDNKIFTVQKMGF